MKPQLMPMDGGRRVAQDRRLDRVMGMMHTLPPKAQQAIVDSLDDQQRRKYNVGAQRPAQRAGQGPYQQADQRDWRP